MRRGFVTLAFVATMLGAATPAAATPEADARATKLFEEGKKQRDANDFEAAIASFAESARQRPSFGAYFNLGLCNEALGQDRPSKLTEALDWYKKALEFAIRNSDARESDARQAIAKLREAHNYVFLVVPPAIADAPGLRVEVDGDVVPKEHLNGEIFLEKAGDHEVMIVAAGRRELRIAARNKQAITVALAEAIGDEAPRPPSPAPRESERGSWGWQKWTGMGLASTGLVFFTIGVVKAFWYVGYADDESSLDRARRAALAEGNCQLTSGGPVCPGDPDRGGPAPAPPANEEAQRKAAQALRSYDDNEQDAKDRLPSTIVFGALGAVMIGLGAYLFFSAEGGEKSPVATTTGGDFRLRVAPRVGPRDGGVFVFGTF